MSSDKTYKELKSEFEAEMAWFESDAVTVEDVAQHYKKAHNILNMLEKKLNEAEVIVKKIQ